MIIHQTLLLLLPLLGVLAANFAKKYPRIHAVALAVIVLVSLVVSTLLPISNDVHVVDLMIVKLKFMSDIYSYSFGVLVNVIWFITVIYSTSYIKLSIRRRKISDFFRFLALTIFAVFGNCYAADLWTLFIFQMLIVLFTAPLILQYVSRNSLKAQRLYLATHIGTLSLLFLPGIFLLSYYTGSVDFTNQSSSFLLENKQLSSLILFLFTLGLAKNCLLPFHNWITRSTIAPNPVSALLHSVAAVKSGSIAIIKIVVYVFGFECIQSLTGSFITGGWIFYLCGITAIYAAWRAWKTTNLKKRFAYSTISQLSYIVSSVMVATPLAIMGSMLHIISHSICKAILFFVAGVFAAVYKARNTVEVSRLAPYQKFLVICVAFCGASIIGFPFLPGSVGKDYMLLSELQTHHYASAIALIMGSIINILYIYPLCKAAFFDKKDEQHWSGKSHLVVPIGMRFAIILAMILAFTLSFFISNVADFFKVYGL